MNITLVTTIFPPDIGGPATYAYEVQKRLGEKGHQVKVVTWSDKAEASPNVYVLPEGRRDVRFITSFLRYLSLFITILKVSKGSDVIYVQNPAYVGLVSLLAARLLRKPIVLRFPGDKAWEKAFDGGKTQKRMEDFLASPEGGTYINFLLCLQRFIFHRVEKIIAPSEFMKEMLTDYYQVDPQKVTVIYHSVALEEYEDSSLKPQQFGLPTVITIGRLVRHKMIDQILRVIAELAGQYPSLNLLIVGDGPERENLERLASVLGIEARVKFIGNVAQKEVMTLIKSADIFVLNSIWEGLSHVAIEAMASRIPVVGTNIKGLNEVIDDGKSGFLVTPDSNEELKDKIIQLLEDDNLTKNLINNAYRKVKLEFTWERNLNFLERELEETVG